MRKLLFTLAAATFAAGASAQQITVTNNGGWTVLPGTQQVINNFFTSNGAGVIMGGASAEVGTSVSSAFTRGAASVQGYVTNPGSVSDGRTANASATETYTKAAGGNVTFSLTARPEPAVRNLRGNGYLAKTTAGVGVTTSVSGWARARTTTFADPSSMIAVLSTLPATISGSFFGTSFSVTMQADSSANGTIDKVGSAIQLFSGAHVDGDITLN